MALQFIFGNSGAGKSHYLYHHIVEQSMKHPDKNYFVIVPEQFTMQTQKDLVLAHPQKGIMNIDVLSFGRLAHRIFEEVGGEDRIILDDTGKSFILRKIAGDYETELKVLRGNLKKYGYIGEVKSIISEFTQYQVDQETLEHVAELAGEESYLYWKLQDLSKVYRGFQEYLSGKYITNEELLDVLCQVIRDSELLKESVVVFDGFTGFTPVQDKLLRELLHICSEVLVTVTMDGREDPYVYKHPYQLFAMSKQTVTSLVRIAEEERIPIKDAVTLFEEPVYRFRENEALAFLEKNLFRYSKNMFDKDQESISLHCGRNPKEEVEFVMAEIRRLTREKGYRYRDIAVIAGDVSVYADYVEKISRLYEIPIFIDYKRSVLLNSFVEYIRSLLSMIEQNFTYESVFRFLRAGFSSFTMGEIDALENYVIALGIRGYKKWEEKWTRKYPGIETEDLERINGIRERFIGRIAEVTKCLKKRRKTVEEITLALHAFFLQEELQKKVKAYEEKFKEEGKLALAKEYAQIYRIVIELFDKFMELLGEEQLGLQEYCELLDAGFEEAKVGVIPPGIDEVMVGDIERTRLKDIKILFFIGANDIYIPGNQNGSGLLSEQDRKVFDAGKVALAPDGKEKMYIQKFYLYLDFTKPTDQLYISYSKVNREGKSIRPSYILIDLKKLYPKLQVKEEEKRTLRERELTQKAAIPQVIAGIRSRGREIDDEWLELYTAYKKDPAWAVTMDRLVEAGFYHRTEERISHDMAEKLYGEKIEGSVTRLERFAACAFAHFLSYGLRLKERKEYKFEALDLGNVFHRAIEIFSRQLVKSGYTWTNLPQEIADELIENSVEMSIADYGNTVLQSSARNAYTVTRIKRLMRRTVWALSRQLAKGDFVPSGYELSFGKGKIDRIDVYETEESVYVKVIDYKTGAKSFSLAALYYGLQLQLAVYMNAALELERRRQPWKRVVPAGLFYYRMKDPIVEKKKEEELEDAILSELRLDGLVNADEQVISHMDRDFQGNSLVIPVGRNKDRSFSKASKAIPEQDFQTIADYVERIVEQMEQEMLKGSIQPAPYELGSATGCDYCQFHGICRFDEELEGCAYRRLEKISDEDVLTYMRREEQAEHGMDERTTEGH